MTPRRAGLAIVGLVLALGLAGARAADPMALWQIVNGRCVPDQTDKGQPAPCAAVDLTEGVARGSAVLKDLRGIAQFLLIPTARTSGIEDPALLAPDAVNYFDRAWDARRFTEQLLGASQPRDAVILAINSAYGRSQQQFHIHIDCISAPVRTALAEHLDQVGEEWARFPVALAGSPYRAIRINRDRLGDVNPFRLLADRDPEAAAHMDRHTLVLAGVTFSENHPGFVLLDNQVDLTRGDFGAGERLQDHDCAVATR